MKWTVRLNGGPQRVNHAAAVVGNKIYSFGGYCTDDDYRNPLPIDVFVLDTETLRWSTITNTAPVNYTVTPFQRYGHTAATFEDSIFIWGGRNDRDACNKLFCFNTELLKWVPVEATGQIPEARDGHSACVVGHCMYIFGGFEEHVDRLSRAVYVLDLRTFIWKHLRPNGEPPGRRDFHSATAIGNLMFVFGGRGGRLGNELGEDNDEKYCNRLFCLDTKSVTWSEVPTHGTAPRGRRSHSAFSYRGRLYIFGGYNGYHDQHFSDIHCYTNGGWSMVQTSGKGPRERRRQCCCLYGDRLFLFGGTSPVGGTRSHARHEDPHLMDHDDLHILDFAPTLKTLAKVAVIENKLDQSGLPHDIRWEIKAMTTANTITKTPLFNG